MRRRRAVKRRIEADVRFNSWHVAKLINMLMFKGKKSLAERIVYSSFDILKEKTGEDSLEVFKKSLENTRPLLETKSRRVGGATYQVPVEVRSERGVVLAMRWFRDLARARHGQPMSQKLASEILDAYNKTGSAMKKREDVHKMAEANRAFSHYRW